MKGNLIKTEQGWFVQYIGHPVDVLKGEENLVNYIPLHPESLNSEIIRWANNGSLDDKQIEFEILDGCANIQAKEIEEL